MVKFYIIKTLNIWNKSTSSQLNIHICNQMIEIGTKHRYNSLYDHDGIYLTVWVGEK